MAIKDLASSNTQSGTDNLLKQEGQQESKNKEISTVSLSYLDAFADLKVQSYIKTENKHSDRILNHPGSW